MRKYALSRSWLWHWACGAYAGQNDQGQNGNNQGQNGGPYNVPDGGSTAALLGLSVALVVLAQRKFAIAK